MIGIFCRKEEFENDWKIIQHRKFSCFTNSLKVKPKAKKLPEPSIQIKRLPKKTFACYRIPKQKNPKPKQISLLDRPHATIKQAPSNSPQYRGNRNYYATWKCIRHRSFILHSDRAKSFRITNKNLTSSKNLWLQAISWAIDSLLAAVTQGYVYQMHGTPSDRKKEKGSI